ncbi:MAG: TetR-like C-terminal domain-containing protein [Eubacteriales bacterium]|nr:TetR-like C-terminal domain-containing protein [Eubacteriales bacterium]
MKTDARVRYTKQAIRTAFLTLLARKPVAQITVTQLCEMAQINRATFYKHYQDPFDLLQQMEDESLLHLRDNVRQFATGPDVRRFLIRILEDLRSRHEEYTIMATPNADPDFPRRVSECLYREVAPKVGSSLPGLSDSQKRMVYRFLESGGSGLLNDWFEQGMKESPEEVSDMILRLSHAALAPFRR